MSQLRAQFKDAADTAMPPSRLTADAVYTAAWRRRRRRTTAWTAGGIVAGVLVVGLGLGALRVPDDNDTVGPPPEPSKTATGPVIAAVAATDADHLFVVVGKRLLGSDDAGRTWTVRHEYVDESLFTPAAGVLAHTVVTDNPQYDGTPERGPKLFRQPRISTDGGRTWRDVHAVTTPVAEVPAGGWITCSDAPVVVDGSIRSQDSCPLLAVDPATARSAPLASPPAFTVGGVLSVPASAGLWVGGLDQSMVAVSLDRGRTWTEHNFGVPTVDAEGSVSADGVTGYVIITVSDPDRPTGVSPTSAPTGGPRHLVYRTGDGGATWHPVNSDAPLPGIFGSYVAADGTHVVMTKTDPAREWHASSDNGATYKRVRPTGLTDNLTISGMREPVLNPAPGIYLAFDDTAVYRSADGIRWTRIPVQVPR